MLTSNELRRFSLSRPPAVLLGGLNVARAAGRGRIPLIIASCDAASPAFASRFCGAGVSLPAPEEAGAIEKLLRLGECLTDALARPVPLLYSDDDYLHLVNENRERLGRYFRLLLNEPAIAAALIDKQRFDRFARERALPVPHTLAWDELEAAPGPILVKPKVKLAFEDSAVFIALLGRAGKARVFGSAKEVLVHPLCRALKDQLLFQQYVAGDDRRLWSFHGYADEKSRVLACFTGRKIRTYPALTGVSTYLELTHQDELAALGREIVARIPLKGVFKIDFKRELHTGKFFLLEVNARFNLWHCLGAANGINIPRVAYDYLVHGKVPPPAQRPRARYRWLSFEKDYRAYRSLAARGELGFWRWLASIAASPKVYALFAWSDPLPFAQHWLRRMRRARLAARLGRRLLAIALRKPRVRPVLPNP